MVVAKQTVALRAMEEVTKMDVASEEAAGSVWVEITLAVLQVAMPSCHQIFSASAARFQDITFVIAHAMETHFITLASVRASLRLICGRVSLHQSYS